MPYQVVSESHSANESIFSIKSIDSPAAIATKKVIDIGNRCLKASNSRLHFCNSAIPIIGLVVGLIGIILQAYATLKDKGKPKWLKALALFVLGATAALTISIFVLSIQFPPIALALSFATIAVGIAMQVVDFTNSLVSVLVAKYKTIFPSKKDKSQELIELKCQRTMLFKKHTRIISALNHTEQGNKAAELHAQLLKIQQKLCKVDKKIEQLRNPELYANKVYHKEKRGFFGACFALSISIGSSILAVIGLTLAVGNPLLGLALIGLGLVFDTMILSRKANKWLRRRDKEKRKRKLFNGKRESLSIESVNVLNTEKAKIKQSFTGVVNELNNKNKSLDNQARKKVLALKSKRHDFPYENYHQCNDAFFGTYKASNDCYLVKNNYSRLYGVEQVKAMRVK